MTDVRPVNAQPGHATRRRPRPAAVGGMAAAILLIALVSWGSLTPDTSSLRVTITILTYVALAQAWNLLGGYAGYLNFGIVIFVGLGAYTAALLGGSGISMMATIPVAAAIAALAAVAVGVPGMRLRGDYFAVATFVITLAVKELALVLPFTGGANGLFVPTLTDSILTSTRLAFYVLLALAVIATALCWKVERGPWFSDLVAIREDEDAAEILGVPTLRVKVIAFAVGAAIAGAAGAVQSSQLMYIEPNGTFAFGVSLAVVIAAVVGGAGTWYGPVLGAVLTQLLAQLLVVNVTGIADQIVLGALLIVVALLVPRGLASLIDALAARRLRRRTQAVPPEVT